MKTLKDELISSIPGHEISLNMVMEVAILAQENMHYKDLSDALFFSAASCLRSEFGNDIQKVFDFYAEHPEVNEIYASVIYKLMSLMKSVPPKNCSNCKKPIANCLDGKGITKENFVIGAKVNHIKAALLGIKLYLVEKVIGGFFKYEARCLDGKVYNGISLSSDYKYDCS